MNSTSNNPEPNRAVPTNGRSSGGDWRPQMGLRESLRARRPRSEALCNAGRSAGVPPAETSESTTRRLLPPSPPSPRRPALLTSALLALLLGALLAGCGKATDSDVASTRATKSKEAAGAEAMELEGAADEEASPAQEYPMPEPDAPPTEPPPAMSAAPEGAIPADADSVAPGRLEKAIADSAKKEARRASTAEEAMTRPAAPDSARRSPPPPPASMPPPAPKKAMAPAASRAAGGARERVQVDPRALPSREEEIWVISRSDNADTEVASYDNDLPISSMHGRKDAGGKLIPMPLKHTAVEAGIEGYLATVDVTQRFHNPFSSKIEAVYVFPLPQNSAVNEFIMTIGDRRIRGIIREKEEAKKMYNAAKAGGYRASLLTQERPNVFTQKVANIEPGKQIDINLKYYNTLAYRDGWYEFIFPMVVAPRYNPPGSKSGVGAAPRGEHGSSGQTTEAQYLRPEERTGHDIALKVDLNAGVEIEELVSRSHAIEKIRKSGSRMEIALKKFDRIPNKDFVLRYRVTGKKLKTNLVTHRDQRGGFFSLMLYPPESLKSFQRKPMEMIFVIDCSGSMRGGPLNQSKAAIRRALSHLEPNDTFQIIRFSNNHSQLGPRPRPATAENIRLATQYLDGLHGSGGTRMIEGIKAALEFHHDPRRLRFVTFLTDGLIGNEADILAAIKQRLGATRIFSFGVGNSPNDYLMDRMAKMGRGAVAYLGLNDSATDVMDRFFESVSHPALTDITIDWGGLQATEVYPAVTPDLFVGRPVILTGKFQGRGTSEIRVKGRLANGEEVALKIPAKLDAGSKHQGLAAVWARRKIASMADRAAYEPNAHLTANIKSLALDYSLMSSYTAFVAVDSSARTQGNFGTTVPVAVPVPQGIRYETTVGN